MYVFDAAAKAWQEFQGKLGQAFVTLKEDHPLLTSSTKPRLRVDAGQTSFFEGKQFRVYKVFAITSTTPLVIKSQRLVNTVVRSAVVESFDGKLVFQAKTGGTEGGTFTALPILPMNQMTERPQPYYLPQNVVSFGGTHSGGIEFDYHRAIASGTGSKVTPESAAENGEFGFAGNTTMYYVLSTTDSGTVNGMIEFIYEERP